jgi:hypothetical protein
MRVVLDENCGEIKAMRSLNARAPKDRRCDASTTRTAGVVERSQASGDRWIESVGQRLYAHVDALRDSGTLARAKNGLE